MTLDLDGQHSPCHSQIRSLMHRLHSQEDPLFTVASHCAPRKKGPPLLIVSKEELGMRLSGPT